MAKSIMHSRQDGTCYLCMRLHDDYSRKSMLQEHHVIFGRGLKKLSEHYGLKVYLCLQHHTYDGGSEAVHRNNKIRRYMDEEAQRAFEKTYPHLVFMDVFGKNVLNEQRRQQSCVVKVADPAAGFMMLDNPVPPPEW